MNSDNSSDNSDSEEEEALFTIDNKGDASLLLINEEECEEETFISIKSQQGPTKSNKKTKSKRASRKKQEQEELDLLVADFMENADLDDISIPTSQLESLDLDDNQYVDEGDEENMAREIFWQSSSSESEFDGGSDDLLSDDDESCDEDSMDSLSDEHDGDIMEIETLHIGGGKKRALKSFDFTAEHASSSSTSQGTYLSKSQRKKKARKLKREDNREKKARIRELQRLGDMKSSKIKRSKNFDAKRKEMTSWLNQVNKLMHDFAAGSLDQTMLPPLSKEIRHLTSILLNKVPY